MRCSLLFLVLLAASACLATPFRRSISVDTEAESVDVKDDVSSAEKFELSAEADSDGIVVKSRQNGTEFEIEFEINDEPRLTLKFEDTNGTETRLRVEFLEVFRFTPAGAVTDGYTNETKTAVLDLKDDVDWTLSCTDVSADPTGVLTCVARTGGDSVILKVQVSGTRFIKNDVEVKPNQVKIQVVINYPAAAGEAIGMLMKLKTKTHYETDEDDGMVNLGGEAFFEWETEFIDEANATHPVITSGVQEDSAVSVDDEDDDKNYRKVYTFASLGAQSVNWDPVFGAGTSASSESSSSSSLSTGAVIGIAVGGACGLVLVVVIIAAVMAKRS